MALMSFRWRFCRRRSEIEASAMMSRQPRPPSKCGVHMPDRQLQTTSVARATCQALIDRVRAGWPRTHARSGLEGDPRGSGPGRRLAGLAMVLGIDRGSRPPVARGCSRRPLAERCRSVMPLRVQSRACARSPSASRSSSSSSPFVTSTASCAPSSPRFPAREHIRG